MGHFCCLMGRQPCTFAERVGDQAIFLAFLHDIDDMRDIYSIYCYIDWQHGIILLAT